MLSLRPYAWVGLAIMMASQAGVMRQVEPFWSWHTPIAWTGYILFVDGLVFRLRNDSWLTSARREFLFLAALSVPLWLVFEFFNLFILNWHYINLPMHPAVRGLGYAWSFATIWPAIFETGELVAALRGTSRAAVWPTPLASPSIPLTVGRITSVAFGAALLVWPLVRPSPYLAAPVWLGFIFLLDPLNGRAGAESLIGDLRSRRYDRTIQLAWAGLVCGLVWEFWNYRARAKWIYTVPILPELKLFEMPLPGYLGFPAFALECFVMYVTARVLLWRGPSRTISL